MSRLEEKIEELVTKPINNLGYRVYDVIYAKEGKDNYLRIFIDNNKCENNIWLLIMSELCAAKHNQERTICSRATILLLKHGYNQFSTGLM